MKTAANFMMGLGFAMLTGYFVIGYRAGADFVHEPFVMFAGGLLLILAGAAGRFVLPKM
jgi:hypothetical protein